MAERFVQMLNPGLGEARLWGEVGLLARDPTGRLAPFEDGGRPWGWLTGKAADDPVAASSASRDVVLERLYRVESSDVERALALALRLLAAGKSEATADEFVLVGEPDEEFLTDLQRLGMALRTLGIPSRRIRRDGGQTRVYELGSLRTEFVARGATASPEPGSPEA